MVLFDKCCCFFRLTTGGLILGYLGAFESLFVIVLSIFGLANVEQIMNHLRNETESYSAEAVNETHMSIFRRNHGEMSAEDAMIIERGKVMRCSASVTIIHSFTLFRHVRCFDAQPGRQLCNLDFIAAADNRCN